MLLWFFAIVALASGLQPAYNPWLPPTPEEKVQISQDDWTPQERELLTNLRDQAYLLLMEQMGWPIDRELYTVVKADEQGCAPDGSVCLKSMQWGATAPRLKLLILRDPATLTDDQAIDYGRGYIHELCHTFRGSYINDNILVEEGLCEWASDRVAAQLGVPNIRPVVEWESIEDQPIPWGNLNRGGLDPTLLSYRFAAAFWEHYLAEDPDFFARFHKALLYSGAMEMYDEELQFALQVANPWFDWEPYFAPMKNQAVVVVLGEDELGNHDLWISLMGYRDGKLVREPVRGAVSHSNVNGPTLSFPVLYESEEPLPLEIRYDGTLPPGTIIEVTVFPPDGPSQRRTLVVP